MDGYKMHAQGSQTWRADTLALQVRVRQREKADRILRIDHREVQVLWMPAEGAGVKAGQPPVPEQKGVWNLDEHEDPVLQLRPPHV